MTFPSVRSTTSSYTAPNSTSHTVALPATVSSGDLLLVFFASDGTPTITWDNSTAGTWTELGLSTAAYSPRIRIMYKWSDGTEGGLSLSVTTSAAEGTEHRAIAFQNAHPSTPPEISSWADGTSYNADPPSLTPSWGAEDTMWIAHHGWDNAFAYITGWPTNYTYAQYHEYNGNSASVGMGTALRQYNATSDDPGTFTNTASRPYSAATIAIRPAPAGLSGAGDISVSTAFGTAALSRVHPPTFPTVAATSSGGTTGNTSHTVTLPSGIQLNDLIIAFFESDGNPTITWDNSTAGTWKTPLVDGGSGTTRSYVIHKWADGTESAAALTITTSATEDTAYHVMVIRGADKNTDPEVSTLATGTSTTPNPAALSVSWEAAFGADTLWIAHCGHDNGATGLTGYPTNFDDNQVHSTSGDIAGCGIGVATYGYEAGSLDPGTFTLAVSKAWNASVIGVAPIPDGLSDTGELAIPITFGTAIIGPPPDPAWSAAFFVFFGS